MNRRLMTAVVIALIVMFTMGAVSQAKKSEQVKCPVCGLSVDKAKALSYTYKGQTYYFESKTDYDAFLKNPEKYIR
ncbi:MAG TPA: YHS domain-containing protein [Terriglobia bacterium]|nr:YHS domain-containing protein [Terriglobia bacterium]